MLDWVLNTPLNLRPNLIKKYSTFSTSTDWNSNTIPVNPLHKFPPLTQVYFMPCVQVAYRGIILFLEKSTGKKNKPFDISFQNIFQPACISAIRAFITFHPFQVNVTFHPFLYPLKTSRHIQFLEHQPKMGEK